jgi:hypothetical protein
MLTRICTEIFFFFLLLFLCYLFLFFFFFYGLSSFFSQRAKVLEQALEQIWARASVLRPSEQHMREVAAAEAQAAGAGGSGGSGGGCDRGVGGRLEEELGRLAVQMRGMDVEVPLLLCLCLCLCVCLCVCVCVHGC